MSRCGGPCVACFVFVSLIQAAVVASGSADAAISARAASALGEDDGCGAGSSKSECALHALQQRSNLKSLSNKTSQEAEDWPHQQEQQQWEFSKRQIWHQFGKLPNFIEPELVVNLIGAPTSVVVSWFCSRWVVYNWPKVAFWSQEVLRRVEALPDTPTAATKKSLNTFVKKASYMMCVFSMDPQNGTDWSPHVAAYMRKVRAEPSTSLYMPDLDTDRWFTKPLQSFMLFSIDACQFWVTSNMCDLGHLARRLKGNKDLGNSVCWDTVPHKHYFPYHFMKMDLGVNIIPTGRDFFHNEYLKCQEHPLTEDILESSCPMFGHYPPGTWGLPEWLFSWGKAPEVGSETYNGVLQCNAKLGVPEVAHMNFNDLFPYGDNVDIMQTPEWKEDVTKLLWDLVFWWVPS